MVGRVAWLIRLRWLAVVAVALVSLLVDSIPHISLEHYARYSILAIIGLMGFYNFLLFRRIRRVKRKLQADPSQAIASARRLTHIQITADLFCLTIILHLAGGLINPLCVFMVFHIAIAGIILTRREAFLIALLASMLLTILGMAGALWPSIRVPIENYPLEIVYSVSTPSVEKWFYTFSVCFVLSCTFFLIAYFTSSVSKQLHIALSHLEDANTILQKQSEAKSRFLRKIAHQMRSPLAAIISLAHAYLSLAEQKSLPQELQDLLDRIERRCQGMMTLIDELLHLTRIQEGLYPQEETELVDVGKVIVDRCKMFEVQANEKGLKLIVKVDNVPAKVRARHRDIADIVENMVTNAIKYTERGEIHVAGRSRAGIYVMEFKDTGIGIPQEDRMHIFDEFFRGSNAVTTEWHSTGLGLNIVLAIVTRLAGKIDFTTKIGEGTIFLVELPLAQDEREHSD